MPAGRPKTNLTPNELLQLEALAGFGIPTEDIALFLGMSKSTLLRNFATPLKKGKSTFCSKLRVAQAKNALKGNATMQIWLGKQLLGQSDKFDVSSGDEGFEFVKERKE